ncbi:G-protein coupled receptor 84 [Varanus komodoensis]|uniref:G protein-coupled receptor 84 n=1 Tax=Varanus komodoensis TaxID=61221 RepID=A0A8D2J342_VARKO|nr:G-protein coupled receptor 84 [Varanus komodoensis]XP_044299109.1 G-protein coupled receptor 84 [Varanus komodoensis]
MENLADNFSCYDPSIVGYRYVSVSWGIVVTIAGTIGNVLTLVAYATDIKLQTRVNLLIVNLTLADVLYCTFLQPFSVDSYLHLHWRTGADFCRVFGMLLFVSNSVSILTLCLIAISRYLLIANTALFDRIFSRLGVILITLSTWVVGVASFAPLWPVYVLVPKVCTCSFHRIRGRPYTTILMAFYFVVGLSCVGIFYFLIHRKVKSTARNMDQYRLKKASLKGTHVAGTNLAVPGHYHELDSGVDSAGPSQHSCEGLSSESTSKTTVPSASSENGGSPHVPQAVAPPKKASPYQSKDTHSEFRRVTRMCFVVFLFFVICYIPFLLVNIFDAKNRAPTVVHMIAANLTWLNSCINPVLYAAMNRQFREAYKGVIYSFAKKYHWCP